MILMYAIHNILWLVFDIYSVFENFDILMHGAGGLATAWTAYLFYKNFKDKFKIKIEPIWILWLTIIAGVALIGVLWEVYEFILDYYNILGGQHQASIADTMGDFVMDLIGAIIFIPFVKK